MLACRRTRPYFVIGRGNRHLTSRQVRHNCIISLRAPISNYDSLERDGQQRNGLKKRNGESSDDWRRGMFVRWRFYDVLMKKPGSETIRNGRDERKLQS